MIITAAQLRAARGLLDWTRTDLAKAANISPETVKNIEHGTFRPQEQTAEAIIKTFAAHDVVFIENEGVQKIREMVKTFVGEKGYVEFLDDIYSTMKGGGKTCQFNFADSIIATYGKGKIEEYIEQMQSISNLEARCLVPEGDLNFPVSHCIYRWLNKSHRETIPYYLYNNKIAMLASSQGDKEMIWVSIYSESLAKAFLAQFDAYWKQAEGIPMKTKAR